MPDSRQSDKRRFAELSVMGSIFRFLAFIFLVLLLWVGLRKTYSGGDSIMGFFLIFLSLPVILLVGFFLTVWLSSSSNEATNESPSAGSDDRSAGPETFNPPDAVDLERVGKYDGAAASGGLVWDDVLEYRVWCRPSNGALDVEAGSDYYCAFASFAEAREFASSNPGSDEPVVLVRQREYIDEPKPGIYTHKRNERIAEWPVTFLKRPRRTKNTIPQFFAADAPSNRMDILLGGDPSA